VIIELAPLPVAPASPADLALGPQMLQSPPQPPHQPSLLPEPQVAEPVPKVEVPAQVTLPRPAPRPVATQPEKPVEKQPARVERNPAAPHTTASLQSEHRSAPVARAPSPGSAASRAAIAGWRDLVMARLQRGKRYPSGAAARGEQGVATLSFSVDRHGRVLSRQILRSSGHSVLDREALATIARAQPLPPFPPAMPQTAVHLSVPIRFSLR
jgi:protein TonB